MSAVNVESPGPGLADNPARYLFFMLGKSSYGIPVLRVREIVRMTEITPVPLMPTHVKGVVNLRGKVVPVIDLRSFFNLHPWEPDHRNCIVVVYMTGTGGVQTLIGLIVDAVEDVAPIAAAGRQSASNFGGRQGINYITAMTMYGGRQRTLLDIDEIVAVKPGEPVGQDV